MVVKVLCEPQPSSTQGDLLIQMVPNLRWFSLDYFDFNTDGAKAIGIQGNR